jgi:predicted amidohydrolase YtcJ
MKGHADLVLRDAKVWTVDSRLPRAEAVAIQGAEILAVGTNAQIDPLVGPDTQLYGLGGRLVLPGFNDAHSHFVGATLQAATAFDLFGVSDLPAVQALLERHARAHPEAEWLIGWRWDRSRFEDSSWPSRFELDRVVADRPVAIVDIDGHSCWVNSLALEELGYTAGVPDPEGGQVLRDADGRPTGILTETAHDGVPRAPALTSALFEEALRRRVARLNALGLTSMSNNGVDPDHFETYARMAREGTLKLRINEWPFLREGLERPLALRQRLQRDEKVRVVGLKTLLDGVLSAHTAWMLAPYADRPDEVGFPILPPERLLEEVLAADAAGFQVMIHAIGDRAVRQALDIFERTAQVNGRRDSRHRIEHIEVAHPDDQPRFAELGVVANMTPMHCTACIDAYIKERLGEPRAGASAYVWRNLVDSGAHLCFGTDFPAVDSRDPDPLQQIFAAVTRTTPDRFGGPVWHPEQRLTVAQAIQAYTLEGAYAEFMDHRKGSITPGKLADLCVLSRDILEAPPQAILDAQVIMTVFDGEVVYAVN